MRVVLDDRVESGAHLPQLMFASAAAAVDMRADRPIAARTRIGNAMRRNSFRMLCRSASLSGTMGNAPSTHTTPADETPYRRPVLLRAEHAVQQHGERRSRRVHDQASGSAISTTAWIASNAAAMPQRSATRPAPRATSA